MQLFSYRKTMANAKPYRPPVEMSAIELRRKNLELECEALSARRAREEARLDMLRRQAQQSIDAANEALRLLHVKWAAEEKVKERSKSGIPTPMTIEAVIRRICKVFNVSRVEIAGNRGDKRIVLARQAVCYWCARRTGKSAASIGKQIGGRDHTTILHGKAAYVDKRAAMGRKLRRV